MFKTNINLGYVNDNIDYQTDMKYTPKTVLLSLTGEKEKQDLLKQIDNYSMLISKNLSIIKNKQKKLYRNRKIVKQMNYKEDKYIVKHSSLQTNNYSSYSTFFLLNSEEIPLNLDEKSIRHIITEKIIKDRLQFVTADNGEYYPKFWNKDVIKVKLKKFKQIEVIRKKYYYPRTIKFNL
jgi:hypothetical protein